MLIIFCLLTFSKLNCQFFFLFAGMSSSFFEQTGERNNEELASDSSEKPQVVAAAMRCFFPSFHRRFYFPSENVLAKRGQVCFLGIGNTKCGQADYL